ncbi:MAG: hypothetical protein K8R74_02790, partial [Bacteroidales bacterium]|nr:hypothetical protein [Bacteroidales bacterium]
MRKNFPYRIYIPDILLYLLLIWFSVTALAQRHKADSQHDNQSNIDSDTNDINQLNKLAYQYVHTNSIEKGFEFAQTALRLSINIGYQTGMADSYCIIGRYYEYTNHYRRA